jgi:hypothetical protein
VKYPAFIAYVGRLCKRANLGPAIQRPRPAETPAQASRAVGRTSNMATGGVFQQAAPQKPPEAQQRPVQQPPQAGRLPQIGTVE